MKKSEKVQFVIDKLEELYPKTPIPLDHTDAYTLLVAVLLSAQCTDKRVNSVTPALFDLASTPEAMMKQDVRQSLMWWMTWWYHQHQSLSKQEPSQ